MKLWKKLVLVFTSVSIYTQVIADIPEELKQHIITHHDATAARSLPSALQRAASSNTADAAQRAAKEVFSIDDEKAAAWLLSQPRLCGNAANRSQRYGTPPATHVRALCAAIREAAPADGVGVFFEGDIDNPALIVATLKEVMDSMLQTPTPPIHRGDDGQYHKGDVDRWLVQASQASNTTKINSKLRAALKAYVAAANLH